MCPSFFINLLSIKPRHLWLAALTRFAVYVFGFEISGFEGDQGQRRVGGMVAERDQQFAALVLQRRLQSFPENGFLREINLSAKHSFFAII